MSAIDAFLLRFIQGGPISAYELERFILTSGIDNMIKISRPAIYQNLTALNKKGYISGKTTRTGKMPSKKTYTITEKGRTYYLSLLQDISTQPYRFYFDFNTLVIGLDSVEYKTGRQLIKNLRQALEYGDNFIKDAIQEHKGSVFTARLIVRQNYLLNKALLNWLKELETEYEKFSKNKKRSKNEKTSNKPGDCCGPDQSCACAGQG